MSKIVAASTKVDTTSLALHETVVMNGKMAVILSKGEGWYTYLGDSSEYDDTFLAATARCFVEKVLAGSVAEAVEQWNNFFKPPRSYDEDDSDLSLYVKWVPVGTKFRIAWNSENQMEFIEIYNEHIWMIAR